MKFKKIMSILGSGALLIGATLAGAVFADNLISSYSASSLKPWTQTNIVYGQNAADTDFLGATNIQTALRSGVITNVTINSTIVSGEARAIETSSQPLYLGDNFIDTKAVFTKEQLPTVLADGKITDNDGKDYDYNQKIDVPNTRVIYGETADNLATPIVYADFDNSSVNYDMRIIFPTAIDPSQFPDEYVTLFGKRYAFSANTNDLNNQTITLFENSKSVIVNDGEPLTVDSHTFSVNVEDTLHAIVIVDGLSKDVREGFSGKINGVDLYVKNIYGPDYLSTGQRRYVELYLGAKALTLQNGAEVKIAGDTISGTRITFINSNGKVGEIKITVTPRQLDSDINYIKEGGSFIDPVFNTTKFAMQGVDPSITDLVNSSRDYFGIRATRDDRVGIEFTNTQGNRYNLDVLKPSSIRLDANYNQMYNSTCTTNATSSVTDPVTNETTTIVTCSVPGTYTYNATTLGVGDNNLIVETNKDILEGDYFVTTSGEYSQIWKVEDIKSDGKIDVRDISSGTLTTISLGSVGGTGSLGLADGSSATIGLKASNIIVLQDKAANYLYSYKGAEIILPKDNSGNIQIVEETQYNGGSFHSNDGSVLGKTLTSNWAYQNGRSGRDMFLHNTTYGTRDYDYWKGDVGDNDIYSLTKYGTFIKQTGSDDKQLAIYYPEDAMKAKFYIGELNSIQDSSSSTIYSIVTNEDSDISSYQSNNIVVVGGSCINAVAAALLGEEQPICGTDFTAKTNVTSGHYLIEAFKNPWNQDKVAILVAGYNAEDTTRAVNDILSKPMDLSVGNKIIG